uniref:DUF7805 domain-containing protein n=1 Tax=Lutzomyia longipalpis TaxID=7200 RepID=A0A1B0CNQ7_LUTLO
MSRRGRLGRIQSPRHTLPPNTTCTYYFHGYPTDLVWIYFTSYHLQILQPPVIDNTTFGQTDVPPWIIRFRVWDSSITATSGRVTPSGGTVSTSTVPPNLRPFHPTVNSSVTGNYYYYPSGQQPPPNERPVNVDNAWNPVENYIYGPTRSSVFNHNNPYGGGSVVPTPAPPPQNRYDKLNNGLSNIKETFNYIANTKYTQNQYSGAQLSNIIQQRNPETNTIISLDHYLSYASSSGSRKHGVNRSELYYRIPCGACEGVYVGTTGRMLRTRVREHYRDCRVPIRREKAAASALCEHSHDTGHVFKFEEAQILDTHQHYSKRLMLEALHIKCNIEKAVNRRTDHADDVLMSRRGRLGRIQSPRHTLPPNTTCTYYFHGYPTDLVWIYFTSYHLQILQPPVIDNTTFGQTDVPPWIIRFRVWDSSITATSGRVTPSGGTVSTSTVPPNLRPFHPTVNSSVTGNYYYYPSGQQPPPNERPVNVDNAWNPVENYIYGPTRSSVFNHNNPYGGGSVVPTPAPPPQNRYDKLNNGLSNIKETFNYIANTKYTQNQYSGAQLSNIIQQRNPETNTIISLDHYLSYASSSGSRKHGVNRSGHQEKNPPGGRKLLLEIFDNETPKLCDHTGLKEASGTVSKTRPCTPLESYVSAGNDLKIEFHTQTGTALFPATFAMQYEFVDTNLGGDIWQGRRGEETPIPPLCSRVFRKRRGDFQSPRNVFLHGRGGARNLTCLYRFEAGLGERIRINLHNVSFGDSTTCITEADAHTGRPRCVALENDADGRIGELKIFDVPYKDVRIPLGCFCDNTSSIYNTPLSFQSNARTLEISFVVTHLNVSEDFGDVYFHASYEIVRIPECRKRLRLKGAGGEDELEYPLRSHEITCEGQPWYIEAQLPERSLFVLTWGTFLPIEPNQEEILRCNTRNRLIIYSGRPLKVMRVICPTDQGNKASALHIFSEDWLNLQPLLYGSKPASMVLEPVFKEPGNLAFSWLEIQRTKASLIQQLDLQTNFTANETLGEFGFFPRHAECEHKCPELDACIGSNLWCDGTVNCPSGYDESEEECGTARKLLELPGGIFAALGCIAAAVAACFIFCIFGLVRKRKKGIDAKPTLNGTLRKDFKKSDLFMDPGS